MLIQDVDNANGTIATVKGQLDAAHAETGVANKRADQLDVQIADLRQWGIDQQKRADQAEAKVVKLLKLAELFAWIIGAELAVIVLFACLKFGLPNVAPPWGIALTFILPVVAFGVVKLLPHIQ